jgi:hypothetical protein
MNGTVLTVIAILLLVLGIVLFGIIRDRRQLQKAAAESALTLSDLSYEFVDFEDPTPFLWKVAKLHPNSKD